MLAPLPATLLVLVLATIATGLLFARQRAGHPVDADPGGYADSWRTTAAFPDKAVHACVAFLLVALAWRLGCPALFAAVIVTAAGYGWERSNGYVSRLDLAADAVGAIAAALAFGSLACRPGFL